MIFYACFLFLPLLLCHPNETLSRSVRAAKSFYHLVHPDDVHAPEEIVRLESLNSRNLEYYIGSLNIPPRQTSKEDARKAFNFLARYDIIPNERACPGCGGYMSLNSDSSATNDKFFWRCNSCRKSGETKRMSLRKGTFFEGLKLTVQQVLYLAAEWVENPEKRIETLAELFKVDKNTVSEVHEWFRDLTQQWWQRTIEETDGVKLGGKDKVVEIDETAMFKAKYNRGSMLKRPTIWVFGLIERGTNKVAMFPVVKRDADTLLPLIKEHVLPKTTIMSDLWRAYGGVDQLRKDYKHYGINHKLYFVDPDDANVHTQSIESTWGAIRVGNFYRPPLAGRAGPVTGRLPAGRCAL